MEVKENIFARLGKNMKGIFYIHFFPFNITENDRKYKTKREENLFFFQSGRMKNNNGTDDGGEID